MRWNWKLLGPALAGLVFLFAPVGLDFISIQGKFKDSHSFLLGSFVNLLNYISLAYFFTLFLRRRQAEKQKRISTVAYRTLSQASNDVLRKVIAPLNGANLYELGLYELNSDVWKTNRIRLENLNRLPSFIEFSGLWKNANNSYLKENLEILMEDSLFLKQMYLIVTRARRDIQETVGIWAGVMFTSSDLEKDLGEFRDLADNLEYLQEIWRILLSHEQDHQQMELAQDQFWIAVRCSFHLAKSFALKGAMPSVDKNLVKYGVWE